MCEVMGWATVIAWVPEHPAAWLDLFLGVLRCSSGRAQQGGDSWSHLQNSGQQQKAVCSSIVTPCHARAVGTRPWSAWRTADWRWLWYIMAVCCLSACGGCGAQAVWGEALERVAEGLAAGRRWLWDEAARRVGILLAAPAAFEGEHFLQARTSLRQGLIRLYSRCTFHTTSALSALGILCLRFS